MKFSVSVAVKICDDGELVCEATANCVAYQSRCDDIVDCPPFNPDESSCYGKTNTFVHLTFLFKGVISLMYCLISYCLAF